MPMETMPERQRLLDQNPKAIKRHRLAAGLGQIALAKKAGIATSYVSKLENGLASASGPVLQRLAAALNCEVNELLASHLREDQ